MMAFPQRPLAVLLLGLAARVAAQSMQVRPRARSSVCSPAASSHSCRPASAAAARPAVRRRPPRFQLLNRPRGMPAPLLRQVVYVTDPAVTFVDGGESAQTYVVGLSGGEPLHEPAGVHRTLDMRAANGTRYRCYVPVTAAVEQGGEGANGDSGSSSNGGVSPVSHGRGTGAQHCRGDAKWLQLDGKDATRRWAHVLYLLAPAACRQERAPSCPRRAPASCWKC